LQTNTQSINASYNPLSLHCVLIHSLHIEPCDSRSASIQNCNILLPAQFTSGTPKLTNHFFNFHTSDSWIHITQYDYPFTLLKHIHTLTHCHSELFSFIFSIFTSRSVGIHYQTFFTLTF
jgi:hypothetical protein